MKKTIMSLAVVSALMSGVTFAANPAQNDTSKATVNFSGNVTASLCQVETSNLSQTISLGEVSKSALEATGKGKPQSFQINLTNCDTATNEISYTLADANYNPINGQAALTYLVPKSGDKSAEGVGVFVQTSTGSAITPGNTIKLDVAKDGDQKALSDQVISLRAYIGTKDGQPVDPNGQNRDSVKPGTVDATGVLTIKAS
ncbi:TPA: type 1 fimbrial protein [Escherichia coli]|nr:type 1 fimbrial protein [Escherichia coli]EFC3517547.1 type 1 fimbrial protein [Escherichia coli]EIO2238710.1 type 1 fimbrial protein [Escherichia coli]ELP1722721.1 type 1 fimbrial protein [Escherichia coli]HBE5886196.1 type 1 fimbrial protein [Escherichia coli]